MGLNIDEALSKAKQLKALGKYANQLNASLHKQEYSFPFEGTPCAMLLAFHAPTWAPNHRRGLFHRCNTPSRGHFHPTVRTPEEAFNRVRGPLEARCQTGKLHGKWGD